MAGVKGRSGRKSWDKEKDSKRLWELSVPVLKRALLSDSLELAKKADIALALVQKMLPNKVEGPAAGNINAIFAVFEKLSIEDLRGVISTCRKSISAQGPVQLDNGQPTLDQD